MTTPVGLRKPWVWVQPKDREELIHRLRDACEYAVHERERENLCSMAYQALRAESNDAAMGRWLLDKMNHERAGDNYGWCISEVLPGDDPETAVAAAMRR